MPKTLYQKLVDSHTVSQVDDAHVVLYADFHIMNEYTSPQAFAGMQDRGLKVRPPRTTNGCSESCDSNTPGHRR